MDGACGWIWGFNIGIFGGGCFVGSSEIFISCGVVGIVVGRSKGIGMGRVFRCFISKDGSVSVVFDVGRVEREFGKRSEEIVSLIRKVLFKCGLERVRVSVHGDRVVMRVLGSTRFHYGRVLRELDLLERELEARVKGGVRHLLLWFPSVDPMPEFSVAVYRSDLTGEVPREERFRVLSVASNVMLRERGVLSDRIGSFRMGVLIFGSESPVEEFSVDVEGHGTVRFSLERVVTLGEGGVFPVDFLKRVVGREIREKLRGRFWVHGREAYERRSVLSGPGFSIHPGFEFSVDLIWENHLAVSIQPKHRVLADRSLWELYEEDARRLRGDVGVVGRRMHDLFSQRVVTVIRVLEERVSDKTAMLGGVSFLEMLDERLRERVSEGEPLIEVVSLGEQFLTSPSLLFPVYTLEDLRRMGYSKEAQRLMQIPPEDMISMARGYVAQISPISLGSVEVHLSEEPVEVELW